MLITQNVLAWTRASLPSLHGDWLFSFLWSLAAEEGAQSSMEPGVLAGKYGCPDTWQEGADRLSGTEIESRDAQKCLIVLGWK